MHLNVVGTKRYGRWAWVESASGCFQAEEQVTIFWILDPSSHFFKTCLGMRKKTIALLAHPNP